MLVWHTDRLHRSPAELEGYIEVCERRGVPTHCVKAGPLDLSTASGRMTARILGAVARQEVEHSIERIRAEKMHAARAGKYRGGRRPFGYEADGVTIRPVEAAAVVDACARVLHGESLSSLAREWNATGIPTAGGGAWTSVSLRNVLLRARNAGIVSHEGQEIAKACRPAIVSEDVWRAVRALCSDPTRCRHRGTDPRWLGSGLYLCGICGNGSTMRTASRGGGGWDGPKRPTYRCKAAAHLSRVAEPIDELITQLVLARLSRPDARLLLTDATGPNAEALSDEAAALRVRMGELVDLFTDGVITKTDVTAGRARLGARLTELTARMVSAAAGSALHGFADASDIAAAWDAASMSRRKAVVDTLMVVTLMSPGRGVKTFDPHSVQVSWRHG